MITCNLNKPESVFDQIRKEYSKLKPTDAAILATALVESGRYANVIHDEVEYVWLPDQHEAVTKSFSREVCQIVDALEKEMAGVKKTKATKPIEDEPVSISIQLKPSMEAAEPILGKRKDLKTLIGEIMNEGVEFLYLPTDVGWHWTLDRVNWAEVTEGKSGRRVKFTASFIEPHESMELGPGGKKRKTKAKPRAKAKK